MNSKYTKEEMIEALEDDGYEVSQTGHAIVISWEGTSVILPNRFDSLLDFFNNIFGLEVADGATD
jgi:hypothetical protein